MLRVIDPFLAAILSAVLAASLVPCRSAFADVLHHVSTAAVALLFFLHGAKLSREAVVAGITHWRLHALVFGATFVVFPAIGLAIGPIARPLVGDELYQGLLFLCALPATIQSAVVFTSIAGGNLPAAICSASLSTLLGIVVTPAVLGLIATRSGGPAVSLASIRDVALEIFLPFAIGKVARRWIGGCVKRRARMVMYIDRGTIILVVYVAFSDAVVQRLWQRVTPMQLAALVVVCAVVLAGILLFTSRASRLLGFDRADEITIVFSGSKKSLASGVAMGKILFAASSVGTVMLPLMIFHQIQLMVCAYIARRYARSAPRIR